MADLGALIHTATGLSLVVRVYPGHKEDVSQVLALPVPHGQLGGAARHLSAGGNAQDDPQILLLPGEVAAAASAAPSVQTPVSQVQSVQAPATLVSPVDAGSPLDNQSSDSGSQTGAGAWREAVSASSVTVLGNSPPGTDASISAVSIAAIRMAPDEVHQAYRQSDDRLNAALRAVELTG